MNTEPPLTAPTIVPDSPLTSEDQNINERKVSAEKASAAITLFTKQMYDKCYDLTSEVWPEAIRQKCAHGMLGHWLYVVLAWARVQVG